MKTFKQIKAIENKWKRELLKINPSLNEESGIYVFIRREGAFKFAYVGQAKHLLSRLAQHCMGYEQHIDLSLKKHKLISNENPEGWSVLTMNCSIENLDQLEREGIESYAKRGYQLLNKTIGGQDKGKTGLGENKSAKGYREGVAYGEEKMLKQVKVYFDKYLDFAIKGKTNKTKERKFEEFKELLEGTNEDR